MTAFKNKIFKLFKLLQEKKRSNIYIYIIYIMSEEFIFFTSDFNDWNYNEMIESPDLDP